MLDEIGLFDEDFFLYMGMSILLSGAGSLAGSASTSQMLR